MLSRFFTEDLVALRDGPFRTMEPLSTLGAAPAVIVAGWYDGVHLGHRARIQRARAYGCQTGLKTVALMLAAEQPEQPPALTLVPRRAELLHAAGADLVAPSAIAEELGHAQSDAFVDRLRELGAHALVVAPEVRFRAGQTGEVDRLLRSSHARGLDVLVEPALWLNGERVSSSAVRRALERGDVAHAARLLGRLHEVEGCVVTGDRRGRDIGFPSANLDLHPVLCPLDGVYAVFVRELSGEGWGPLMHGIASLGPRPTFSAGRAVEVHLFDFDRDIYGTQLRVGFVQRLRAQQRFADVTALRAQIARDCAIVREALASAPTELTRWL